MGIKLLACQFWDKESWKGNFAEFIQASCKNFGEQGELFLPRYKPARKIRQAFNGPENYSRKKAVQVDTVTVRWLHKKSHLKIHFPAPFCSTLTYRKFNCEGSSSLRGCKEYHTKCIIVKLSKGRTKWFSMRSSLI